MVVAHWTKLGKVYNKWVIFLIEKYLKKSYRILYNMDDKMSEAAKTLLIIASGLRGEEVEAVEIINSFGD